jgi:hypothetical protein
MGEQKAATGTFGLDLINNSWVWTVGAGNCDRYGDYGLGAPELDAIVRGSGGRTVSVFNAIGNERDDGDCPLVDGAYGCVNPPGTAKNIVTVGGTYVDDTMTPFSSWGPVDDGRLKPDVVAPCCERGNDWGVTAPYPGDTYHAGCGTSQSAPTATGVAALLQQLHAALNGSDRLEPSMVKALLVGTAIDLGTPGPDYAFGHGRINARAAADALIEDTPLVTSIHDDEVIDFSFVVPAGLTDLRLVAAWDDPPGSDLADPALVNDIDLVLVGPGGQPVRPWVLDPDNPSLPATRGIDRRNNLEHVRIVLPAPGPWVARLSGTNVPVEPQVVSLVGIDLHPPASPAAFRTGETTGSSIALRWWRAPSVDRKGTLIARAVETFTWAGPNQGSSYVAGQEGAAGVVIAFVGDADYSFVPFVDAGLDSATTYVYAAYTFDTWHNYSAASRAEGTTGATIAVETLDPERRVFALEDLVPNPTSRETRVEFSLAKPSLTTVRVFDALGRHVRAILDRELGAGSFRVVWDGRDGAGRPVAPGVYFIELRSGADGETRRVIVMP